MERKIYLCNWTHTKDMTGGMETDHYYLNQLFPNSELVTIHELSVPLDVFYNSIKEKNKNDIIISHEFYTGEEGYPDIIQFGNPMYSLSKIFPEDGFKESLEQRKNKINGIKVANSNFMKDDLRKSGIEADYVINNGVDTDFFQPVKDVNEKLELRKKYNLPEQGKIGIFVGDANNIKNFEMLGYLIDKYQNIFWIIVNKTMKAIEEINESRNFKFFLDEDRNTIKELLQSSDFFILTSPAEGCSNAIFEAMSCGLPCIVSNTGYFWDFWDFNVGFRVKYNDFMQHCYAIDNIDTAIIKCNPRKIIFKQKLDLNTYKEKWRKLIDENFTP